MRVDGLETGKYPFHASKVVIGAEKKDNAENEQQRTQEAKEYASHDARHSHEERGKERCGLTRILNKVDAHSIQRDE